VCVSVSVFVLPKLYIHILNVSVFVLPKLYIHILKTGEQILSILLLGDYYFKKNPYEQRGFDVIIPALSIHCVSALTQNPSPACRL